MKLLSIGIERLFDQFDYEIPFNQEQGITILTGPNGYGKTTILNIVDALFSGDHFYANYAKATLFFSDGRKLEAPKDKDAIQNLIPVYSIKDQRLAIFNNAARLKETSRYDGMVKNDGAGESVLYRIACYSNNLVYLISQIKSEEEEKSNTLNTSYATRLFEYKTAIPKPEFAKRYRELTKKYQLLQKYKIYQNDLAKAEYEGENQRPLSIYLEDWEAKIAVYDKLLAKIELFVSIMEAKCLINKTFTIDATRGFCFTGIDGKPLRLVDLSSGEQHETILLYELLFNAPPDSLVLIDEPETSMHVAWQHSFLSDLKKIREINSASFLVATHSPSLINEHWDWSIDLFDLVKEAKNG